MSKDQLLHRLSVMLGDPDVSDEIAIYCYLQDLLTLAELQDVVQNVGLRENIEQWVQEAKQ